MDDRQDVAVDVDGLVELGATTLIGEGVADSELSVSLVSEDEMTDLHERFTGEEGSTDVLSFPLDRDDLDEEGYRLLGDVVIAPSVAERNNPDDPGGEVRLLLVHGILHLLGHDHAEDSSRAEMWAVQARYTGLVSP